MKKHVSLFVSVILISSLLFLNVAYAETNTLSEQQVFKFTHSPLTSSDFGVKEEHILNDQSKNVKSKNIKDIKLSDIVKNLNGNSVAYETAGHPDQYEPNNDYDTAFPYSQCEKHTNHPYWPNYITASIHNDTDDDVYSIQLTTGKEYFLNLTNLANDYDMVLVSPDTSQHWHMARYGTEQEYFYFTPARSGKYYVVILGNGQPSVAHNYYLYVGESVVTELLMESTELTFKFRGAHTTDFLSYSTVGKIREDAVLDQVWIDNNGNGSWLGLTKYLKAQDGNVYSSQPRTGLEYIQYPARTQYAAQNWRIAGQTFGAMDYYFVWKPNIKMKYSYLMKPKIW